MSKSFAYSVEEIEPPTIRFLRDSITVTRKFKLAWSNHRDFLTQVLGTSLGKQDAILPDKLAEYQNIEAVEATVEDFMRGNPAGISGAANSTADKTIAGDCVVTVIYSTEDRTENTEEGEQVGDGAFINPHNPGGPPIILEYEADESAEVMAIPGRHFRDQNGQNPGAADEYIGIAVLNTLHRITLYDVDDIPPARSSLRGKVNDRAFEIPVVSLTIPKECGLFRGSTLQRRYTARDFNSGAEPAWTITYQIAERVFRNGEVTWNHVFSKGKFVRKKLDGKDIYPLGDFSGLFFF